MPPSPRNALSTRARREATAIVKAREPNCWLCRRPINLALPAGHRWSSTVDEIIPRSHGGSATDLANLRHAHHFCNSSRGNRPPRPVTSLHSVDW